MLNVKIFVFNPFQENTYVLYDEGNEAIIIDPGCYEPNEEKTLHDFICTRKLHVKCLLNTHGHIDHVLGNAFVKHQYRVPLLIHKQDEPTLRAVKAYASNYGFSRYEEELPDAFIQEGEPIKLGKTYLEVLFLPGHTPGHVGFYQPNQKMMMSGDVLFKGSIGRTDLPGGDTATLLNSIKKTLFALPDDVIVYSGHGKKTTLGAEKNSNPFCKIV